MKRKKLPKISTLRNRCDALYQKIGKGANPLCEICNAPVQAIHHFFPKRSFPALRFTLTNGIPLCNKCHTRHELMRDPVVHSIVLRNRGWEWYDNLVENAQKTFKQDRHYYIKTAFILENSPITVVIPSFRIKAEKNSES